MEIYRDTDPDLADCEPTVKFIRRVDALIVAMTSRSVRNSLNTNEESNHLKVKPHSQIINLIIRHKYEHLVLHRV